MDLIADPDEMRDLTAEQHPDRARMMEVLADALIVADDAGKEHLPERSCRRSGVTGRKL